MERRSSSGRVRKSFRYIPVPAARSADRTHPISKIRSVPKAVLCHQLRSFRRLFNCFRISRSWRIPSPSRLEEGSSSTNSSGPMAQALAQAMRCFLHRTEQNAPVQQRSPLHRLGRRIPEPVPSHRGTLRLSSPKSTSLVVSRLKNWDLGF